MPTYLHTDDTVTEEGVDAEEAGGVATAAQVEEATVGLGKLPRRPGQARRSVQTPGV